MLLQQVLLLEKFDKVKIYYISLWRLLMEETLIIVGIINGTPQMYDRQNTF